MGSTAWAIISLLALVAVIIIANVKNINVGLVGIAMAMLVGTLAGVSYKNIVGGFNYTLFIRAMGMQSLIVVAKMNGTLEVIAQKIIKIGCGRAIKLLPIFLYVALIACEFLGTGVFSLALPVLIALAFELGMPALKVAGIGLITMTGGAVSPYAPPGIILRGLIENEAIDANLWNTAFAGLIVSAILFAIFYFVFGWYKEKPQEIKMAAEDKKINWKQWLTLVGYVIFVFCNLVLGLDTGLTPIIIAIFLCLIGVADGSQIIKRLPFNSLIMVGGMTIMVGVVSTLGGIDIITSGLTLVATKALAPGLMAFTASGMSVISSAQGVVMPTLIPTVPGFVEAVPGVSAQSLVSAVGLGAYATGISPLSTTGANVMANYGTVYAPDAKEEKKLFNQLLIMAGCCWLGYTIAGLLGLYNIVLFK